jgi:hypothetical protein
MAGAWRSLRYDMGRRTEEPPAGATGRPVPGEAPPDVTSTGMSTFGGGAAAETTGGYDGFGRPPRRLVAVGAFVTLAVVGAAGSYFAVVSGLGGLLRQEPAAAGERPLAAAAPVGDRADGDAPDGAAATSGLGRGPAQIAPERTGALPVLPQKVLAPVAGPAPARPERPGIRPAAPGTPTREDCDCLTPPVPTPTAPPSAGPSPSSSPSPSPSESSPEPDQSPSAEPGVSGDSSAEARRRHRHG